MTQCQLAGLIEGKKLHMDGSLVNTRARTVSQVTKSIVKGWPEWRRPEWRRPHGFGVLDPETSAPYPKNPVIGAFFREIDRADELGSGMRNMMQYGNKYGGADPQLIEGDVFRMVISVPEFGKERGAQSRAQSGAQSHAVLAALTEGPRSAADLVEVLQLGTKTGAFKRSMKNLLEQGCIAYTFPDKPSRRLQKYRLTDEGRTWLKKAQQSASGQSQTLPSLPVPAAALLFDALSLQVGLKALGGFPQKRLKVREKWKAS